MKIAVMSVGNTKESLVCDKFGRAPYIIIYNTSNNLYEAIENSGGQSKHGAGPDTAELLIENGIDLLLTKEIGIKAYSVLAREHIEIKLVPARKTVSSVIKQYLKNK
jgi:predicted Fe-Mo cluster-binding NifX family protein